MGESYVGIHEGVGKAVQHWQKTVGANSVLDPYQTYGEYAGPTYVAVAQDVDLSGLRRIIEVGSSTVPVRIRRVRMRQNTFASIAQPIGIHLYRNSTIGTGGTDITPVRFDPNDPVSATTQVATGDTTLPSGSILFETILGVNTATPTDFSSFRWQDLYVGKGFVIPATDSFILWSTAASDGTFDAYVEWVELGY